MRLCLFEDPRVDLLEPLTFTRPVFELICGQTSLAGKQLRFFGFDAYSVLIRSQLAGLFRQQHPEIPANDLEGFQRDGILFVNGRWMPPMGIGNIHDTPHVALLDGEVAYAVVPGGLLGACSSEGIEECLGRWKSALPHRLAEGKWIHYLWDLVEHNSEQIRIDFESGRFRQSSLLPEGVALTGPLDQLYIAPDARVESFVVIDVSGGPVVIDSGAVVTAFSRLEGPCCVGPQSQVMGAKIRAGTTLGKHCRVGGEVEASIIHGHSNKYHEGFLGHSYVGEWVNLGAGTHNSDLRNDYGEVSVPIRQAPVKTGLGKVGCFIGDHTKTGLGTLINTGSNIGIFANLLPAGMLAPKFVPSFCNLWKGLLQDNSDLEKLFATAEKVMRRRGCTLTEAHLSLYRHVFEETAYLRRDMIQEVDRPKIRRTA